MMIAAYRMGEQGWTAREAMQEMHEFGYRNIQHLMCPGLEGYEKGFPERLRTDPMFDCLLIFSSRNRKAQRNFSWRPYFFLRPYTIQWITARPT